MGRLRFTKKIRGRRRRALALQVGPGLGLDAALLGAAIAEGPLPAPAGRLRAAERRRGVAVGADAGLVPVGGRLVGERGDGALDAGGEAPRVLTLGRVQRG